MFLLSTLVSAAPEADLVTSLPGWYAPLPSPLYSGFLSIPGSSKKLHYLLVEAEKPLDKATAPLVLWLNGGPGCSSLEGFFYEHGPLVVGDAHAPPNINFDDGPSSHANATGKLFRNPWSWSRAANVLYLEAPAGVGFSYSPVHKELSNGDNGTAADNLAALEQFFLAFPEYKTNDFYVSGESCEQRRHRAPARRLAYPSGECPLRSPQHMRRRRRRRVRAHALTEDLSGGRGLRRPHEGVPGGQRRLRPHRGTADARRFRRGPRCAAAHTTRSRAPALARPV